MNSERKCGQFCSTTVAITARIFSGIVCAALMVSFASAQDSPASRLKFTQDMKLLDCEPVTSVPCFRIGFSALAPDGTPARIPVLTPSQMASSLTVDLGDRTVKPFLVSLPSETSAPAVTRLTLFLIDTSGSMNRQLPNGETRFHAAKAAISRFLQDFENGADRVAVVGFESHGVVKALRSARFATSRGDAQSEVDTLAEPKPHNNTALYSAVDVGTDVLREQIKTLPGAHEAFLFLLTDGDNDVQESRGDDHDLLSGPAGLRVVVQKVRDNSDIRVIAVGIGSPKEVNQDSLSQISSKFTMITDAEELMRVFKHPAPTVETKDILATFSSPWPDRASLAARTIHLRLQMKLPTEEQLNSDEITWTAPEVGQPVFDGRCDAREGQVLLRSSFESSKTFWMRVFRPLLVFAAWGAALLVLWFWVPPLIWSQGYEGVISESDRARWGEGATAQHASLPGGGATPAGFERGRGGVAESRRETARRLERHAPPKPDHRK
ncbi:MAG TPA: vWA domain-containing protein [Candidatus Acidoferrum sp.]|nr:vWA domain-containing protein [Candidatus Acidoferrum sp.]